MLLKLLTHQPLEGELDPLSLKHRVSCRFFTAAVLDVFEVDMETLNTKVRRVPEIDMA